MRLLATDVRFAQSRFERARGVIGRPPQQGEVWILPRARQIHTFGLDRPIDVVFCDPAGTVVGVYRCLRPRRITYWMRAGCCVLESAAGGFANVDVGDRLYLRSYR